MTIRDRIYFRVGLFHKRHGRMWAAFLEGLLIAVSAIVLGLTVFGLANLAQAVYEGVLHEHAEVYKQQAQSYQASLIQCLNGGIIGRTENGETVGCQGALTFRLEN